MSSDTLLATEIAIILISISSLVFITVSCFVLGKFIPFITPFMRYGLGLILWGLWLKVMASSGPVFFSWLIPLASCAIVAGLLLPLAAGRLLEEADPEQEELEKR